jgi:protein tyrosine phosphatase (PTP) superfamily phosphohydrolase (DUF442 family)
MEQQLPNYLEFGRIGTAGQPTAGQFAAIRAVGFEVVINLALGDSPNALPDEADLVVEQGMAYVHIPVIWEAPTSQDLERFFQVMDIYNKERVLVHCVVNKRASVFVFLYRVLRLGVPLEKAQKALLQIWQPDPVWQRFVNGVLNSSNLVF